MSKRTQENNVQNKKSDNLPTKGEEETDYSGMQYPQLWEYGIQIGLINKTYKYNSDFYHMVFRKSLIKYLTSYEEGKRDEKKETSKEFNSKLADAIERKNSKKEDESDDDNKSVSKRKVTKEEDERDVRKQSSFRHSKVPVSRSEDDSSDDGSSNRKQSSRPSRREEASSNKRSGSVPPSRRKEDFTVSSRKREDSIPPSRRREGSVPPSRRREDSTPQSRKREGSVPPSRPPKQEFSSELKKKWILAQKDGLINRKYMFRPIYYSFITPDELTHLLDAYNRIAHQKRVELSKDINRRINQFMPANVFVSEAIITNNAYKYLVSKANRIGLLDNVIFNYSLSKIVSAGELTAYIAVFLDSPKDLKSQLKARLSERITRGLDQQLNEKASYKQLITYGKSIDFFRDQIDSLTEQLEEFICERDLRNFFKTLQYLSGNEEIHRRRLFYMIFSLFVNAGRKSDKIVFEYKYDDYQEEEENEQEEEQQKDEKEEEDEQEEDDQENEEEKKEKVEKKKEKVEEKKKLSPVKKDEKKDKK